MILYRSLDDGALYSPQHIDNPDDTNHWDKIEVPEVITIKAEQLCTGYNDIAGVLLKAKIAKKVK